MARPRDEKRKILDRWQAQYGASEASLRHMRLKEFKQLLRMEEHARATIFSTSRWERDNPHWRKTMKKMPKPKESDLRVHQMMQIVDRLAGRRVA